MKKRAKSKSQPKYWKTKLGGRKTYRRKPGGRSYYTEASGKRQAYLDAVGGMYPERLRHAYPVVAHSKLALD